MEEIEAKRRRAIEELRGRLLVLWEQLDVDEDIKRNFLEENQGCRQQVSDWFSDYLLCLRLRRPAWRSVAFWLHHCDLDIFLPRLSTTSKRRSNK